MLAVVTWLAWICIASTIVRQAGVVGVAHSPRMAVWWHLIPVLGLVKPMLVYVELAAATSGREDWQQLRPSHLAAFAAGSLALVALGNVARWRVAQTAGGADAWLSASRLTMASGFLQIVSMIALILFARKLLVLQRQLTFDLDSASRPNDFGQSRAVSA